MDADGSDREIGPSLRGCCVSRSNELLANDRGFRGALLASCDAPAEHWLPVRSTYPNESTFATVHLRTDRTIGRLSRDTPLAMVFKLVNSTEHHGRRLNRISPPSQMIENLISGRGPLA